MKRISTLASIASTAIVMCCAAPAFADEHVYSEGEVVNISKIRTENGHFDDYMKYLDTTWKAEQEAFKKAGLITGYQVLTVEPRGTDDPDIILIVRYKNWAAYDGWVTKYDEVMKQVEGSLSASDTGMSQRDKIRRTLGSMTAQELKLK